MAEEDNILEERSADEIRKDREEAIVYNVLNKILPNAADWATEEILFPLYAPTALLK